MDPLLPRRAGLAAGGEDPNPGDPVPPPRRRAPANREAAKRRRRKLAKASRQSNRSRR
jgi:hypothetical protein